MTHTCNPELCGIIPDNDCPLWAVPSSDPVPSVRNELAGILAQFDAADRRMRRAAVYERFEDLAAAELERMEAEGQRLAAGQALGDLFLLLLRNCREYRSEALQLYLGELMRPHLDPLADAVVGLGVRQ